MTEESRRRNPRGTAEVSGWTFFWYLVAAVIVGVAVTAATHALDSWPELSTGGERTAEHVVVKWWLEWWDAGSAGALAAVSVILAATIWAKPLPDASPAARKRTLVALTAITVVVASFPVVTLLTRLLPPTITGLWIFLIGAGGLCVVFICLAVPIGLGRRVPSAVSQAPPKVSPAPQPSQPSPVGAPRSPAPAPSTAQTPDDAPDDGIPMPEPPVGKNSPRPRGSRVNLSLMLGGAAIIAAVAFMIGRRSRP